MATTFETNVIKVWGDAGRAWLNKLPYITDILSKHWNLTNLNPVNNLSYNYVLTGYQGILPVVLKISCNQDEMQKEVMILQTYNGNHCIKLVDSNLEYNACLLENAIPGNSLKSLFPDNDDEALLHTVTIMQALHSTPIPNFNLPTLQFWLKDLYSPHQDLNRYHINKAQNMVQDLFATQTNSVLLHGDLHHDNILQSYIEEPGRARHRLGDGGINVDWLAIDPKGIIGDPAFEVYAFIRNPNPQLLKSKELISHRLQLFSKYLSIDVKRLHAWIYVQAVLEACWVMNDGSADPKSALAEAEQIDAIKI
jgi:streptomycin 6-kinase